MLAHFEQYLRHEKHLAEGTIRNYTTFLGEFMNFVKVDTDRIKKETVRDYLAYLKGRGLSNTGMANHITALRTFYRWRADENGSEEMMQLNHFLNYRIRIKREETVPYVPSVQEVEKLRKVLDAYQKAMSFASHSEGYFSTIRDKAMIELLIAGGMRSNELRNLRHKDIDLERKTLLISTGKGSKQRYVLFNGRASQALKELFRIKNFVPDEKLFPLKQGNLLNYKIKKWAKRAQVNLRIHAHSFRHYFITQLLAQGMPQQDVADLAGHADLNTTRHYTHLSVEHKREKYNQCKL